MPAGLDFFLTLAKFQTLPKFFKNTHNFHPDEGGNALATQIANAISPIVEMTNWLFKY
jgi:hypothetical protein